MRGLNEVSQNQFGGGPLGLASNESSSFTQDSDAMRGDFGLTLLIEESTQVRTENMPYRLRGRMAIGAFSLQLSSKRRLCSGV